MDNTKITSGPITLNYSRKGIALYTKALDETVQPIIDSGEAGVETIREQGTELMKGFLSKMSTQEIEEGILGLNKAIGGMRILQQLLEAELIIKVLDPNNSMKS